MTPSATFNSEIHDTTTPESSDDEILIRRRKRKSHGEEITGLNLTAMMDVMTILLVFLLKQFAEAPENITLTEDLTPPTSISRDALVPGVKLLISKTAVMVDNDVVIRLENGNPIGAAANDINAWTPVAQALATRRTTIERIGEVTGKPFDGSLMVIADSEASFEVITQVLYQAGREQFVSFRLIVQKSR